jgi:Domain of unknown function (DUF5063)
MAEHGNDRAQFRIVASEFCGLYEQAAELGAERFLLGLARTLPRLHAAGVALPFPATDEAEIPDDDLDVRLGVEERQAVDWPVAELLKRLNWSEVQKRLADPTADSLSLYDDLSGIYADLKEGFLLLEAGRPEAEAVFGWRLTFWSHWGYHSAAALRLVHYYAALYLIG